MKRRKHKLYYIVSSYIHALQHIWRKRVSFLFLMIVIVFCICIGLIVFIRSRIYNDVYYIHDVLLTEQSLMQYNDMNLYSDIMSFYHEKYYHTLHRWKRSQIVDQIQLKYPFVSDVTLKEFANNTLLIDVSFQSPLFRLRYNDSVYGIYKQHIVPLLSGDIIADQTPLILLPIYLSGTSESISGILYQINPHKLLSDYLMLKTAPIQGSFTYIPGGEKYILRNDRLRVYFNAKKDISGQLLQLFLLYKYYPDFERIRQIDIGSIANPIID